MLGTAVGGVLLKDTSAHVLATCSLVEGGWSSTGADSSAPFFKSALDWLGCSTRKGLLGVIFSSWIIVVAERNEGGSDDTS